MKSLSLLLALIGLALFSSEVAAGSMGYESGKRLWFVHGQETHGGLVTDFLGRIEYFEEAKITVVIGGNCGSACTLYTRLLKKGLLCAQPGTKMVFHRPYQMDNIVWDSQGNVKSRTFIGYLPKAEQRRFWLLYPPHVRREIQKHRPEGLPNVGNELTIRAKDLGIPICRFGMSN